METAKVFTSGRSQAVRIPKGYRFGAEINEVYVNKVGDTLLLTPMNKLRDTYNTALDSFTEDFLADGRPEQLPVEERLDFS